MKLKVKYIVWIVLGSLFFIVGVPIIINEAYKINLGYMTLWKASDVLSYYGAVLGGGITLISLVATISFTRGQLRRDRYLERETSKWNRVDSIISQALTNISPLRMRSEETVSNVTSYIHQRIVNLQSYAITAKTSLDTIKGYIHPQEYKRIAPLISEIAIAIENYCAIESKLEKVYMDLQMTALQNNGIIPDETLSISISNANEIVKEIPSAYDKSYQQLINLKRDTFEKIYIEIEETADKMLCLWRKP